MLVFETLCSVFLSLDLKIMTGKTIHWLFPSRRTSFLNFSLAFHSEESEGEGVRVEKEKKVFLVDKEESKIFMIIYITDVFILNTCMNEEKGVLLY